jgi:filamentous hemagglutinin family protein
MRQFLPRLELVSSITLGYLVTISAATAQIVPDNTLPVNSSVTPGCTICTIDGGTVRGVNLFHSFSEFSVPTGGEANFNNALQIQSIFSRVTGNSVSNIDGLIRTNAGASLFFLNPNGIIFGPNAQLNIGGSFFASTASSFKFPNGSEFSATNPTAPPLLSINVTPGLQWGASRPGGTITSRGNLAVGQDLTLAAGNLDLQGQLAAGRDLTLQAQETVKVRDTIASPFIATSARNLTIQGNQIVDILALSHPQSKIQSGGNLNLVSDGNISGDAHFFSGGSVSMRKDSGTPGNFISEFDPIIAANGDVLFGNYTGVALKVETTGSIQGGNIRITGPDTTIPATDPDFATLTGSPSVILRAGLASVNTPNLPQNAGGTGFTATLGLPLGITVGDIDTSDSNGGNGGNIILSAAKGSITTGDLDSYSYSDSGNAGNGGAISLNAATGSITTGNLDSSSNGSGNGGDINLATNSNITTQKLDASTSSGNGGDISLISRNGEINTTGEVNAYTDLLEAGNGGSITLQAKGDITTIGMRSDGGEDGKSGDITLTSETGTVLVNSGEIDSQNNGSGNGGDINITAMAGSIFLRNGAVLNASTFGEGKAGNVIINARDTVAFDGVASDGTSSAAFSSVEEGGIGDGGDIKITTGSLAVTGGAQLVASTRGEGKAGRVIINARDTVAFDGVDSDGYSSGAFSSVGEEGKRDGGDINITTGSLAVTGGAVLSASTRGEGKAGSVIINARDTVAFDGVGSNGISSAAYSSVEEGGKRDGGNINITTGSLAVTGGAFLDVSTLGEGKAGSVIINARDTVAFDGVGSNGISSAAYSSVERGGKRDGGDIKITTGSLFVTGGAVVSARTRGQGNGGKITVRANTMDAANGGQVLTTSLGTGEAGDINLNVTQRITLSGSDPTYLARLAQFGPGRVDNVSPASGVFANTLSTSTNRGGDLTITTGQLTVRDGAQVSVKSEGTRNSGNLYLTANSVLLDNQGQLIAETASGGGGNIDLQVEDLLLMRHNSLISAKAIGDADGGNVNIETKFLIAIPPDGTDGSDIIASAQQGSGGKIDIDAAGIFGLEERRAIPGNRTNDIDASSEFGSAGDVTLSTLINPSQGLSQLPTQLVDPTRQIDSSCAARGDNESKFTVTGRGGLPSTPSDLLTSDLVLDDFGTLATANPPASEPVKPASSSPHKQLVEAQGWIIAADGKVILTALAPSVTPHTPALTPASCQDTQK